MGDLTPFKKEVRRQEEAVQKALASGTASASDIAVKRLTLAIMQEQLHDHPALVESYQVLAKPGHPGELAWTHDLQELAVEHLFPDVRDPVGFQRKIIEYADLADQLRRNVRTAAQYLSAFSREVLIVRHNPATKQVIDDIAAELERYRERHEYDDDHLTRSARDGLADLLLRERQDLNVMLRIALDLGSDVTAISLAGEERPAWIEAVEFAVGAIPIVGNVVAVYESASGVDLFGYPLSDVERGILAASVLLPVAGRVVKGGRALYTASRLSRLYGGDAFRWSYTLAMGERLSADAMGMLRMKAARAVVTQGGRLGKKEAADLAAVLKSLDIKVAAQAVPEAIDPLLVKAFADLVKKYPKFAVLDELSIGRIGTKIGYAPHAKGQLMEEFMEHRLRELLQSSHGKRALGLEHIKDPLEYIPGHLIRDSDGLQLTDGILVRRAGDTLEVVAVFEAKAGESAAGGLAYRYTPLSEKDLAEMEGYARDVLRDLQERARLTGGKVTTTLEQIRKTIKKTEAGGQIRSDVERLSERQVFINGVETKISVSPQRTRWFGVVPKDVKGGALKQAIKKAGIRNVDIIGLDVLQRELKDAINTLLGLLAGK